MKKQIPLVISFILSTMSHVVVAQTLSTEGRGHFKAAIALTKIASSVSEYEFVATEFEKVIESDPEYADTYINLCKIYGQIGTEKGEEYFEKAEKALETYKVLMPDDYDSYQDEKIILNAMKI